MAKTKVKKRKPGRPRKEVKSGKRRGRKPKLKTFDRLDDLVGLKCVEATMDRQTEEVRLKFKSKHQTVEMQISGKGFGAYVTLVSEQVVLAPQLVTKTILGVEE